MLRAAFSAARPYLDGDLALERQVYMQIPKVYQKLNQNKKSANQKRQPTAHASSVVAAAVTRTSGLPASAEFTESESSQAAPVR